MADEIICSNCATPNRADRRFCRSCGSPLASGCPVCGASNDPGDRFCGNCGTVLPGAPATGPIPGAALSGTGSSTGLASGATERRLVSVLFADLVGFTPFAEDRDPEAVREALGRYFEVARERIERYGGSVEKFIGDAVMAVWGTPVAHEDDPERAVRAALELVDAVAALDTPALDGARLAVRAAVLTGEAAVDTTAVGQGMVTGDLVNTASRLQGAAAPRTVLVDEATARAAEQAIVFEPAGDQVLKGKAEPLPAWRVVRVVGGIGGQRRAARLEPPFVGRDDELRLIKDQLHASEREGRARLVSVTGIAGIGKSRLAWELYKYIDGLVETIYWHQGRSPAYGEGLAFWALGEMVRQRAGLAEGDDRDMQARKLAAMLEENVPDPVDRERIEPRLAGLLGIAEMPPGGAEEVYAAWRTLFERIAERGPTVLVFEDLHWADPGLLDFIEDLATSTRHRPILILTLARPELLERRPTWGAGVRRLTTIELGPLPADAMDMLLLGIVPGIPPEAIRAIRDRSEGVPLYAVETVRMLLDKGSLTEQDGRYRLAGELGSLAVPESLTGLLGARIDGVSEREREILGHAAVLGQVFDLEVLDTVAGLPSEEIRAAIDDLAAREIVELDDDPRSPTRGQYRFVQGLMREVVYGRLSRRERMARHLAVARELEALESEELAGVVASHYLDAWRSAPPEEAPALAGQAREALTAAADRAASLGAADRALGYVLDAEQLADDDDTRLAAGEAVLAMTMRAGRYDLVHQRGPALEAAYVERGNRDGAARVATWRGMAHIHDGRPDEGRTILQAALDRDGGLLETSASARLAAELARSFLMSGRPGEAFEVIETAMPVAERLDLRNVIAELLPSKGWALAEIGRRQESVAILVGAVDFAEREGHFQAEARARMNLSAWLASEDPRRAFSVAADGYSKAADLGYLEWTASLFTNAASMAFEIGEWSWAADGLRQLDPDRLSGGWQGIFRAIEASLAAYRGDVDVATTALDRFREVLGDRPDPQLRSTLAYSEAEVALCRGDLPAAMAAAELAADSIGDQAASAIILGGRAAAWLGDKDTVDGRIAFGREQGALSGRVFAAQLVGLEGSALALAGDEPGAIAAYDRSTDVLRDLGVRFDLALTLLDRLVLLPDAPGRDEAAAEARSILEPLGALPFLERLDAALDAGAVTAAVDSPAASSSAPSIAPSVAPPSA